LLRYQTDTIFETKYDTAFIGAKAQSRLLRDTFDHIEHVLLSGALPYNYELELLEKNNDTEVLYFPKQSVEEMLNLAVYHYKRTQTSMNLKVDICSYYGVQESKHRISMSVNSLSRSERDNLLSTSNPETHLLKVMSLQGLKILRGINSG
jgi:hypothetical protein